MSSELAVHAQGQEDRCQAEEAPDGNVHGRTVVGPVRVLDPDCVSGVFSRHGESTAV